MEKKPGSEHLTLRDAARKAGVHENTIRNWVAEGHLHPLVLPGSTRRKFDPAELDRVLRARRGLVGSIQDSRRAVGPELVDATLLELWADRLEARGLFPELIRALLAASPDVRDLSLRAGEGIGLQGWDALADGGRGSAWVPAGRSAWELGTGGDPERKAQADFRKRTSAPQGVDPAITTFVFATPRRWAGAREWERRRRDEGRWRSVRVLDADDIEGWLRSAPAVHTWISEQLGLRPRDAVTAEEWWERFAARTRPPLPAGLLLAGREGQTRALGEAVDGPPGVVGVQASSRDEAVAFIALALRERAERDLLSALAVVVSSSAVWDRLVRSREAAILIPAFEGADVSAAHEAGHQVVVPLGAQDVATGRMTIELPPPHRSVAARALEGAGMLLEDADRLAALARRSLSSLMRELAIDPRAARPPWAQQPHAAILAPLVLVGSWSATDADQAIVAKIVDREWAAIERELAGWMGSEDPPLVKAGGEWRLAAPREAFSILEQALTIADLNRWCGTVREVLGDVDPALELPAEKRPLARLTDRSARCSESLRAGLSQGLALLGAYGERTYDGGMTGRDVAASLVRELLARANADETGVRWSALSFQLPLLAEAAPQAFLDAVDDGLAGTEPLLKKLFQDRQADAWLSSSSAHTGLLWALERLCWSREHLRDAALALGRLAEIDPGGRLANRPPTSLCEVFVPWIPHTAATLDERFDAIDALRLRCGDVAWSLLTALMPKLNETLSAPNRPHFRDWRPERDHVAVEDWRRMIAGLVDRALEDAGGRAERWADLADEVPGLPPDDRSRVLDGLAALDPQRLETSARLLLWRRLTDLSARHRSFPDAGWSLDDESLGRLEAARDRLEPLDALERHARLFEWHPDVPGVRRGDYLALQRAVDDLRAEAVREVLDVAGPEGLVKLAGECTLPGHVGVSAADVAGDRIAADLLARLGAPGASGEVARGWVQRMVQTNGFEWVHRTVARLREKTHDAQAAFLLALPSQRETWDLAAAFEEEVERDYWKSMRPWAEEADALQHLLERLLEHERPWAGIDLLATTFAGGDEQARPPVKLVERVLQAALRASPKDDPHAFISGYEVGVLLDWLVEAGADTPTLVRLEWAYFSLLEHTRVPRALYASLAKDPDFFVELLSRVYRGRSQRKRDLDEHETALANRAWEVLYHWRTLPGQREDGTVDADVLLEWVKRARFHLSTIDRSDIGDEQIGQLLSGSLPGADGAWPAEGVREVIETIGSRELENGLYVGRLNARGITTRRPYDGGDQERSLAATYRQWARQVKPQWSRTARVLQQLADNYEWDARRQDAEAERDANAG